MIGQNSKKGLETTPVLAAISAERNSPDGAPPKPSPTGACVYDSHAKILSRSRTSVVCDGGARVSACFEAREGSGGSFPLR